MTEHQAQTDQVTKIELASSVQQVLWTERIAAAGGVVGLDIFTHYVGNNSEMKIEIQDQSGKTLGTYNDKISGNHFWAQIKVPENAKDALYATVKLPKHGLEQKSGPLLVLPIIEVTNLKWDKEEARRGDILKLTADVKGAFDGTEAIIEIWEYDSDSAHDLITKFPVLIKNQKIETEWDYQYYEDADEIPSEEELEEYGEHYNPPEYFFTVTVGESKFGKLQESGLVVFRDWIEVKLTNGLEEPIADEPYTLYLPDGTEVEGKTDESGMLRIEDVPPGEVYVSFPAYFNLYEVRDGEYTLSSPNVGPDKYAVDEKDKNESNKDKSSDEVDDNEDDDSEDEFDYEYEDDEEEEDDEEKDNEEDEIEDESDDLFGMHDIYDDDDKIDGSYSQEPEDEYVEEFETAVLHSVTGDNYHLAVINYISVLLVDEFNKPINESINYRIKNLAGQVIHEGISDSNGRILYHGVAMGDFELVFEDGSVWVQSVASPFEIEIVELTNE